jgi:hypothetical protein
MSERDGHRPFAHRAGHPFRRSVSHVAGGEHPRGAGLERKGIAVERPAGWASALSQQGVGGAELARPAGRQADDASQGSRRERKSAAFMVVTDPLAVPDPIPRATAM